MTMQNADQWSAASSKASGLIIDGTVGGRAETLEVGIDITRKLGGDSMLVVLAYPQNKPLQQTWKEAVARMKAAALHAEKQGIKMLIGGISGRFTISAFDMAHLVMRWAARGWACISTSEIRCAGAWRNTGWRCWANAAGSST